MRQSNLLLLNTVAVYLRTLLTIPIGILTVRFAFGELGDIDYGLWSTVGATTALMAIVSNAMIQSAQRHMAHEVGGGDTEKLASVFRTVFALFLLVGLGIGVVGAMAAPGILATLTIPENRSEAAWWVLHISISMLVINACVTPYRAMLSAHQQLTTLATTDFAATVLAVVNAWCLRFAVGDKLTTYVLYQLVITLVIAAVTIGITLRRIPLARTFPRLGPARETLDIASFAGWSFVSNMAGLLRSQGAIVLVNVVFGPVANAALALAIQAHNVLYRTASALNSSISPALVNQAGKKNRAAVVQLMKLGCKIPFFAASLIFVPLVLDCEGMFNLWLSRDVPVDTAAHTRWLAGMAIVGIGSWGHQMVLSAENRIALVSQVLLASIATGLAMAWGGCRYLGWPPWSVSATMCLCTMVLAVTLRPLLVSRLLKIPYPRLLASTFGRSLLAALPCFGLAMVVQTLLPAGMLRLLAVTLAYALTIPVTAWYVGFDQGERSAFSELAFRVMGGLRSRLVRSE